MQRIKSRTATCDRCAQQTDSPTTESETEATLCPTCVEESAIVPELVQAAERLLATTYARTQDQRKAMDSLRAVLRRYHAAEDV